MIIISLKLSVLCEVTGKCVKMAQIGPAKKFLNRIKNKDRKITTEKIFIKKSRGQAKMRHKNTLVVIWPDYNPNQSYSIVHTP